MYSVIKTSRVMITCFNDKFLKTTFSKFDNALTFLNTSTLGGMFKPRLIDKELHKKSGFQRKVNGLFEDFGYKSEVIGINGSKPSNIRGDRVLLLIYDEAGSWPNITTAIIQGLELCEVLGVPVGTMAFGGTGRLTFNNKICRLEEESSRRLSSNIGKSCENANPEINSEIAKGSESSYSVESE